MALKKDFCARSVKNGKEDFIQGCCNGVERVNPECGKDSWEFSAKEQSKGSAGGKVLRGA